MPAPEPMPGYGQLLKRGYGSLTEAIKACGDCGWELSRRTWTENAYLGWGEVLLCGLCALGWTVLRRAAARRLFGVSPYRRGGTGTGGGGDTHTYPPGTPVVREGSSPPSRGRVGWGKPVLLSPGAASCRSEHPAAPGELSPLSPVPLAASREGLGVYFFRGGRRGRHFCVSSVVYVKNVLPRFPSPARRWRGWRGDNCCTAVLG